MIVISIGLGLILLQTPDLNKPVDYSTVAKPIGQILVELSKQTGVNLICTPDLENEPLVLKFSHVPLQTAMDKIAYVMAGEWKPRDKQWELRRSDDADKKHQQVLAANEDAWQKGLAYQATKLKLDQPYSSGSANEMIGYWVKHYSGDDKDGIAFSQGRQSEPITRLLLRILQRLDMTQAFQGNNVRQWYSNKPTKMELELPDDLGDALDAFYDDQKVADASIDASGQTNDTIKRLHHDASLANEKPIDRILLDVHGGNGRFSAGMFLADANGSLLGVADLSVFVPPPRSEDTVDPKDDLISLSAMALQVLQNFNNEYNFHELPDSTKDVLTHPTETDPLAIGPSDLFLGRAGNKSENVACLPCDDCDYLVYQSAENGKFSFSKFKQSINLTNNFDLSEQDGWLTGSPKDPLEAAHLRLSRPAMEAYLHSFRADGLDLEALENFEADARPDSSKFVISTALMALENCTFGQILPNENEASEPGLALLGTLTDEQRQTAKTSELKIRAGELSDQQMDYLSQWLFGYGQEFLPTEQQSSAKFTAMYATIDGRGLPAEVLGNGFPPDSYVSVTDRTDPEFDMKMSSSDGGQYDYGSNLEDLARTMAMQEHPEKFPDEMRIHLDKIWLSSERTIKVKFIVGNRSEHFEMETGGGHDPGEPASLDNTLKKLSPEQKSEFVTDLEKFRADIAAGKTDGFPISDSGGAAAPPR